MARTANAAAGLTVVIATHNGAQTLPTTLDSFTRLEEPAGGWKLLIVDNASSDATPKILDGFRPRLPLTVIRQPRPGKNRALNTALAHVEGGLIVFTDDDVVPKPDWLQRLQDSANANPGFHIFGGAIVPRWVRPPVQWVLEESPPGHIFGITPPDWTDGPIPGGCVWGANMAVRAVLFERGLRFNEAVGPTVGNYVMGSETDFNRRAEADGFKCWHVAGAIVEHIIRPHQVEPAWIIRRGFRAGRQMGILEGRGHGKSGWAGPPRFGGVPLWLLRSIVEQSLRAAFYRMTGQQRLWFRSAFAASYSRGVLATMRAAVNQKEPTGS
jgi:hypothetical protein